MMANLDAMKAWDLMHDPDYMGTLDMEGVYDLVKQATGDDDRAQRTATERGVERQRKGLVP
jgi:hypothetical protein